MRMLNEDELRDAILLVFANKQVSYKNQNKCVLKKCGKVITINRNVIGMVVQEEYLLIKFVVAPQIVSNIYVEICVSAFSRLEKIVYMYIKLVHITHSEAKRHHIFRFLYCIYNLKCPDIFILKSWRSGNIRWDFLFSIIVYCYWATLFTLPSHPIAIGSFCFSKSFFVQKVLTTIRWCKGCCDISI